VADRTLPRSLSGELLDELELMAADLVPDHHLRTLEDVRERVAAGVLNLVVLGEFKRGKSTLINALLGRALLPTGVIPLTAAVTIVRPSHRDGAVIHFENGTQVEEPLDKLGAYVTEAQNPANRRGVDLVVVEARTATVTRRLQLVDTPGLASVHEHNTEAARRFMPRIDASLCVLAADQPLTGTERELLQAAARETPRVFVVINRIDTLSSEGELRESVRFIEETLAAALPDARLEFFPVSAVRGDGLDDLRTRLAQLAGEEGQHLQQESLRRSACRVALETARAARFEMAATRLPIDELGNRSRLFNEKLAQLSSARQEAGDLLERGLSRLLREELDRPLELLRVERADPLRRELVDVASRLPTHPRGRFTHELEAWVDQRIRQEFDELVARLETATESGLAELQRRHAERIARILADLENAASDIFGEEAAMAMPEMGLREPSRFSFKLQDVRHALDQIVTFSRSVVPGPMGRRMVVKDGEVRLIRMLDRHAGRLASELRERARETVRAYERDLGRVVDAAAVAVRAAVARATEERRRGEQAVRFRVAELERISNRCDRIVAMLDDRSAQEPRTVEVS
jgi:small GTP-binding protein